MDNFGNSRTVHTIIWDEIKQLTKNLQIENYIDYINNKENYKKNFNECVASVKKWLKPVVDLSEFDHVYHTNGTHAGLDNWLARETRPVYCLEGEYTYITAKNSKVNVVTNIQDIPTDAVVYLSNPFSANGCFDVRYYEIVNPIVLDISYVGTTKPYNLVITPNTESVYWSLSKPFGLGAMRSGLEFHRHSRFVQRNLYDTSYFNPLGVELIQQCIGKFGVTEKYSLYQHHYSSICKRNSLVPSDSLLLATSQLDEHNHFKRENGVNRLPVAKILEEYIK